MGTLIKPLKPNSETPLQLGESSIKTRHSEIRVKGKGVRVPSVQIDQRTVITMGKWLKLASVRHEELVEGDTVADPQSVVSQLKRSGLGADLFTFAQRLPNNAKKYKYFTEWENAAVIPITNFSHWWKDCAEYSIRKAVNRAKKLGVVVKVAQFNDEFVQGTCPIYNEVPVRQGKAFWHYGKDFQTIKRELGTYLERSTFLAAYYHNELIGFMKITWVNTTGTITQILSMKSHFDKRPNNALIAKAIEICESECKTHFIYGSFVYYDPNSTLTEFKRRNGFEPVPLPRYYIPLTLKGKIALRLGLHRGIAGNTPEAVMRQYLKLRRLLSERKLKPTRITEATVERHGPA
jgi:hypothetical protein